ncbi:hypothetical protein LY76DRAFT_610502 [Colletotrichum caudatum]|nr:hypothetical protein LY76DRAFT_610502 [Colletotrichum caudatum]
MGANRQMNAASSNTIDLWLESLTSYAESVCGDLLQDLPPYFHDRMLLRDTEPVGGGIALHDETFTDTGSLKITKTHRLTFKNDIHYISSKGKYLVGADGVSNVVIWDTQTGKQLGTLDTRKSHSWDIYRIKTASICGHDSEYIMLLHYKVGASLWEWKKGKRVLDIYMPDQDLIKLRPVHLEGNRLVVFWHDKNTIWKSEKPKWKKEMLVEIPGPAEICHLGIWGTVAVALMKDGNAVCLETSTGSIKARKSVIRLGQEDKCANIGVGMVLLRQIDDGHRIMFWIPDEPNGSFIVITWDVEKDRVTQSEYGGYGKQETESGKPRSHGSISFFDRGVLLTHAQGIDLFDYARGGRRRYHDPFPHRSELRTVKDVWHGFFRRKLVKIQANLGPQVTVGKYEQKYNIATRAPGGGVEVWDWDVDESVFGQQPEQKGMATSSVEGSTLTAGS